MSDDYPKYYMDGVKFSTGTYISFPDLYIIIKELGLLDAVENYWKDKNASNGGG